MPTVEGEFEKRTVQELRDSLEAYLKAQFGSDIDLTDDSVFSTIVLALANMQNEEVEADLKEVYESAFLADAEEEDLEKVVEIIGLVRRSAVHATGAVVFSSDDPVTQTYTIQGGTEVQTNEDEPIVFETQEAEQLELFENFEGGSLGSNLTGDTGNWSVQGTTVIDGSFTLQGPSIDDSRIIDDTDEKTKVGDTVSCGTQLPTNAVGQVLFGVQDSSNMYFVEIDQSGTFTLQKEVGGTEQDLDGGTAQDTGLTIPADTELRVEIAWGMDDKDSPTITATLYDSSGATETEISELSQTDGEWDSGGYGFGSGGANDNKYFDNYTTVATSAGIRASEGGIEGNVGADSLTVMPSIPTGVDDVTNPHPTGDSTFRQPDGDLYTTGQDRESDEDLRERAREGTSASGGSATHDAIVNHLVNNVPDVQSVTIFENKTETDNTGSGGLPATAFEAVVFGGTDEEVAEAIFEKKAVTSHDYGGANGTDTSVSVTADSNGQQFTISFSRPSELAVDMTLDLVVTDTYVGDDVVKDEIVEYVGGTLTDDTTAIGLGVGENVFLDEIEQLVLSLNGVRSVTSFTTTPASTTNANSESIVSVGANEVASTDATDGSITLNVTSV